MQDCTRIINLEVRFGGGWVAEAAVEVLKRTREPRAVAGGIAHTRGRYSLRRRLAAYCFRLPPALGPAGGPSVASRQKQNSDVRTLERLRVQGPWGWEWGPTGHRDL